MSPFGIDGSHTRLPSSSLELNVHDLYIVQCMLPYYHICGQYVLCFGCDIKLLTIHLSFHISLVAIGNQ